MVDKGNCDMQTRSNDSRTACMLRDQDRPKRLCQRSYSKYCTRVFEPGTHARPRTVSVGNLITTGNLTWASITPLKGKSTTKNGCLTRTYYNRTPSSHGISESYKRTGIRSEGQMHKTSLQYLWNSLARRSNRIGKKKIIIHIAICLVHEWHNEKRGKTIEGNTTMVQ